MEGWPQGGDEAGKMIGWGGDMHLNAIDVLEYVGMAESLEAEVGSTRTLHLQHRHHHLQQSQHSQRNHVVLPPPLIDP